MPREGPHNWSPEGRRRQLRSARKAGLKTLRNKVGIFAPGYVQSEEARERSRQQGIINAALQREEQTGLFEPGFHDRPEVRAAKRRSGRAALLRGDGVHSPDSDHSTAGRLGAEQQPDLYKAYGRHVRHHINDTRKYKDVFCIFCDAPHTLPGWFFERLKTEFQGGSLESNDRPNV